MTASKDSYKQLNRLAIAKLTSTPTPGVLYSLQKYLTTEQTFSAQRLINKLRPTR